MSTNDKKDIILKSACELFAAKGFHHTKMIDIAENAGIGKGTIYEYFSSKDVLFIEFIKESLLNFYLEIDQVFSGITNAVEKLEKFIRYETEHISVAGKMLNINSTTNEYQEWRFKNPDIHDTFFEAQFLRFSIVKKIIEEGIASKEFRKTDSSAAAISVLGSLTSFLICKHELHPHSEKFKLEKTIQIEELLELLLNGLSS